MPIQRVALIGHCGFDSGSLTRFAQDIAPGAEVVRVNDQKTLNDISNSQTLMLVNRVLDGRFDVGGSGIALIESIAKSDKASPTMLVSNFEDAQQAAEAAGALPGFGKSQIADAAVRERVAMAIAAYGSSEVV